MITLQADDPRVGHINADGTRQWPARMVNGQPLPNTGLALRTIDDKYFVVVPPNFHQQVTVVAAPTEEKRVTARKKKEEPTDE